MGENWGKAVAFGPVVGIEIAKDDEAILAADGIAFFVFLEGGNCHGRESIADERTKKFVLAFGEYVPSFKIAKAVYFLFI